HRKTMARPVDGSHKHLLPCFAQSGRGGFTRPHQLSSPFCSHYVFLPRLQSELCTFIDGWNNHPLRKEQNLTPNQLWEMGRTQNPVSTTDHQQ
ncbi:hypothetical protein FQA47_007441, partial [Oryzias melastigma]